MRQSAVVWRAGPPLENGDELEAEAFLRRYEAMPEVKKAELVDGIVHLPRPSRFDHSEALAELVAWLGNYPMFTPRVRGADNPTVRLDSRNVPQPDAVLFLTAGQPRVGADGFLTGAPELVAEVAASSVSIELGRKLEMYRRHGTQEYLVWRVDDDAFDWFRLRDARYVRLPEANGVVKSEVFPGLWLHVRAMLAGDLKTMFETLQQGVGTAENAEFVRRLAGAKSP